MCSVPEKKGSQKLAQMWSVLQTNLRRLLGFSPCRLCIRLRVLFLQVCVSCRKVNTGLIANVNNAVLLRGLLNASQAKLKDMREIHDLE